MEAKRNYERTRHHQMQQVMTSGGHVVMAVSGRRPSTDGVFPKRDFFGKPSPAVNLVSLKQNFLLPILFNSNRLKEKCERLAKNQYLKELRTANYF